MLKALKCAVLIIAAIAAIIVAISKFRAKKKAKNWWEK